MDVSASQSCASIRISLGNNDVTGVAGIYKGHRNFPVTLNEIRKLLYLRFAGSGRSGCDLLRSIFAHDNGCGGSDCHCPGFHMRDSGIGRADCFSLGCGIQFVIPWRLGLLDDDGRRIMVVLGVRPGEETSTIVNLPALSYLLRTIGELDGDLELRSIQRPPVLILLADCDLSNGVRIFVGLGLMHFRLGFGGNVAAGSIFILGVVKNNFGGIFESISFCYLNCFSGRIREFVSCRRCGLSYGKFSRLHKANYKLTRIVSLTSFVCSTGSCNFEGCT